MKQQRAYQYRCYPTPSQRQMLAQTFGCVRFVYNWGLRLRTDAYRERGEHVFYRDTSAALTTLKQQPELAWLNEVSSVPPSKPCVTWRKLSATSLRAVLRIRNSRRSVIASRQNTPHPLLSGMGVLCCLPK